MSKKRCFCQTLDFGDHKLTKIIIFHAKIGSDWHLYSQDLPSPNAGPLPTEFAFDVNQNIELIGKVTEEKDKMHSVMDDAFGVQVNYYDGEVTFTQKVKLKSAALISYQSYVLLYYFFSYVQIK